MIPARNESPIDPPDDGVDPRAVYLTELSRMQAIIAALQADTWRLIAEKAARDAQPTDWWPLKAASFEVGVDYETARYWCEHAIVVAEKRGGRWFVDMGNLRSHVGALRAK